MGKNPTDRGRKASKLSVIVDDNGIPFAAQMDPANRSDMKLLTPLLQNPLLELRKGVPFYADKGYDSKENRKSVEENGLKERIFKRKAKCCRRTHAKRGVVERYFSWHDKYRRLIQRYEKQAFVYLQYTLFASGLLLSGRESNS